MIGKFLKRFKKKNDSKSANFGGMYYPSDIGSEYFNGEQFNGSIGNPYNVEIDLEASRIRSLALSRQNPTAITAIKRLLETRISSGLILKSNPKSAELGYEDQSLDSWSERVESWFRTFSETPRLDLAGKLTFAQIQKKIYYRCVVDGDVLVVNFPDPKTGMPRIQLIKAYRIKTPPEKMDDSSIVEGVEYGRNGEEVAYYVQSISKEKFTRIRANYTNGRFKARLVRADFNYTYAGRGIPPLLPVINDLTGIDSYKNSTISKKKIESKIVGSIESETAIGAASTKFGSSGLVNTSATDAAKQDIPVDRPTPFKKLGESIILENLPAGSKMRTLDSSATDVSFDKFNKSIKSGIYAFSGLPPEAAEMSYSSNYSASQAANSDLRINTDIFIKDFTIIDLIFKDFLLFLCENEYIDHSYEIVKSFVNDSVVFDLWSNCEWTRNSKNVGAVEKQVKSLALAVESGFMAHSQATEEVTGIRASEVYKQAAKDNATRSSLGLTDNEELTT